MQAHAVCSAGGLRFLSPPLSLLSSGANSRKTKQHTPACASPPSSPNVCLRTSRPRTQSVIFYGRGARVFASRDVAANGNGASYMSASETAAAEGIPEHSLEISNGPYNEQQLESGNLDPVSSEEMRTVLSAGSLRWILAPTVLISSLLLPQIFLIGSIQTLVRDGILSEILVSFASEMSFYIGMTSFLFMAERLQRPYLSLANYKWGLITNHRSYLYSDYLTMGIKVAAPIMVLYMVWPVIGLPATVAVAPFLVGLAVQYVFEELFEKQSLTCWPLLTIIFEVYRLYQLNKGAHFVERLMLSVRRSAATRDLLDKGNALVAVVVVFQVLGVVCLWSLATFLLRLLPEKTVQERL